MADPVSTSDSSEKSPSPPVHRLHKRSLLDKFNLGYVGAGFATLINAWHSVNNYFYKDRVDLQKFEEPKLAREAALEQLKALEPGHTIGDWYRSIREKNTIHKNYTRAMDEIEFGGNAKKGFFLGTLQKLERIEPHQRTNVGIQVGTVAAIAVGAIFSFSRERRISLSLEREEAKNDQLNARQSQSR